MPCPSSRRTRGVTHPASLVSLDSQLSAAVADWSRLEPDDDTYLVDGVRPGLVCSPTSAEEMSAAVRAADQAGAAVIPWGGGTRMALGFPPRAADLVIRTEPLDEIVEYEPADLTVTVQAGIRLGALQERLRAEGQFLALDPAAQDRATIGGIIAANASGPLRLLYGSARDLVIGTRVVNADGVISKAGGRVVKNVAGYDLNKLYIGSLGTVGIVVELSFKLHPLPQSEGMLLATFGSVQDAAEAVAAIYRSPLGVAALELLDPSAAADCPGQPAVPGSGCALIVALLKAAVPPARSPHALTALRDLATEIGFSPAVLSHAGSGIVYLRLWPSGWDQESDASDRLASLVERGRSFARGEGGSLVVESCPAAAKTGIDVWGEVGDAFPVMRSLKEKLDPNGRLNPGRFVGRL